MKRRARKWSTAGCAVLRARSCRHCYSATAQVSRPRPLQPRRTPCVRSHPPLRGLAVSWMRMRDQALETLRAGLKQDLESFDAALDTRLRDFERRIEVHLDEIAGKM